MSEETTHRRDRFWQHSLLVPAIVCFALLISALVSIKTAAAAADRRATAVNTFRVSQGLGSDGGRATITNVNWNVVEVGAGTTAPSHTEEGRSVAPESGASKKPAPDLQMPEWMIRLPPWMDPTTPKVGSPAAKREEAESARQEQEIRRVIEGVCRAC